MTTLSPRPGHNPKHLAELFVQKGLKSPHGPFTPLQVIKLVYLAHGWMLALYGVPLSSEEAVAMEHGPVMPSVYGMVKIYGKDPISHSLGGTFWTRTKSWLKNLMENRRLPALFAYPLPDLDAHEKNLVQQVLDAYRGWSGIDLSAKCHEPGSAWTQFMKTGKEGDVIPDELVKAWIGRQIEKDPQPQSEAGPAPAPSQSMETPA